MSTRGATGLLTQHIHIYNKTDSNYIHALLSFVTFFGPGNGVGSILLKLPVMVVVPVVCQMFSHFKTFNAFLFIYMFKTKLTHTDTLTTFLVT